MKLLFDQNISPKIVKRLEADFPGSTQVRYVGLEDAADSTIFKYARQHDCSIVTFDADFVDLVTVQGAPPKVIWLRTGNLTTRSIEELLRRNTDSIIAFLEDEEGGIFELSAYL